MGERGAGAVFFSGCNLRCKFCQNGVISQEGYGKPITPRRLREIFEELVEQGAACLGFSDAHPFHGRGAGGLGRGALAGAGGLELRRV